MRELDEIINSYRVCTGAYATDASHGMNGAFRVPVGRVTLNVIASDGGGWDHVSVSLPDRCPTWEEMCTVKEVFFRGDEWVIQYHPPRAACVNNHAYCLHLWRPQAGGVPTPPPLMVGIPGVSPEEFSRLTPGQRHLAAVRAFSSVVAR